MNDKRIRRLWRGEGIPVPQRRRKKPLRGIEVPMGQMCAIRPNALWTMDFQFDTTADHKTLKLLNVNDEYTREALAIVVDRSIDGDYVVAVLDHPSRQHSTDDASGADEGCAESPDQMASLVGGLQCRRFDLELPLHQPECLPPIVEHQRTVEGHLRGDP